MIDKKKKATKPRRGADACTAAPAAQGPTWDQVRTVFTYHNAALHLRLYRATRNGLLLWRAYLEFRDQKLPVPDNILQKFDRIARCLVRAENPRQVAQALEMDRGFDGATKTKERERKRDLLAYIAIRIKYENGKPGEIYRDAAKKFGYKNATVVRQLWSKREKR